MAGRPRTRAKRMEYFEGSLSKGMDPTEKASITAVPVIFRPPRLDNVCWTKEGRPYKWGLGVGGGTPALFEDGEEMAECIDRYFAWCAEQSPPRPPTVAGLSIALGFKSKSALFQYIKKGEDFEAVIEFALSRIEDYKNVLLLTTERSPNGILMDLINLHGWKHRSESTTTIQHEAGSDLTKLLTQLQGNVLRPGSVSDEPAIDAEFEPVVEAPVKPEKPPRLKKYMLSDNIDDLL